MPVSRRIFLGGVGAASAATLLPRGAFAAWPDRPIRLIVPFAAGGNADIVGRLAGEQIGKLVGGTVVVENRGGGGGGIGAEFVARAAPDGYTLLVGSNGPLTVNPFVNERLNYDPLKDFEPIALTSYVPHALAMSGKGTAKTLAEVMTLSKTRPVTVATSGVGSATHMTLERFKHATGVNITHVPYRSGGAMMPDLLSGAIDGAMTEISTALPMHKDGQVRICAVAAAQRSKTSPDIPTFIDGGVKDFTGASFVGILAPARTPADIVAKLQEAVEKGLAPGSTAAQRIVEMGGEIATAEQMTAKGFAAFIRTDYENMKQAAAFANIKPGAQ